MERFESSSLRVLVVDNCEDYVTATTTLLQVAFDCEARGCTDGSRAVDMVEDFQPHLLLLDIAMPKADGFAVIHQLQQRDAMPHHVVAVSGFTGTAITARCLRAGFHGNVPKPVELDCLQQLVTATLDRIASAPAEKGTAPSRF